MSISFSFDFPFFTAFENRFKLSLSLQFAVLLLAAFIFQDGYVVNGPDPFRFILLSIIAYWSGVFIIMIRRNGSATALDRFLIAWGYPLAVPLVVAVSFLVPVGLLRHG